MDSWRMAVLGGSGVGKTALIVQLTSNFFDATAYDPTIEDAYRRQLVVDNRMCLLEVIDTAGVEEYAPMHEQWLREGQGCILVYSITSRSSFEEVERFYQSMRKVKQGDPTFILVANKCDSTAHERDVSKREGAALARRYGCDFIEVSARTTQNVERLFINLVRSLRQTRDAKQEPRVSPKIERRPSKRVMPCKCVIM